MKFSSTLKYLREENNVTQEDLAKYLGISRSAVAGYETKGKQPDFERLLMIADYFKVSTDYLLRGDEIFLKSSLNGFDIDEQISLLKLFFKLSKNKRTEIRDYISFLNSKHDKE